MIVVDTNILVYLFMEGEFSTRVESLFERDPHWAAPVLWRSEFRNVLAHYMRKDILSLEQSQEIMNEAMRIMRGREYEIPSFQVLRLVSSSTCSAYDCEFVALARDLNTKLVTVDQKILREFSGTAVSLGNYIS